MDFFNVKYYNTSNLTKVLVEGMLILKPSKFSMGYLFIAISSGFFGLAGIFVENLSHHGIPTPIMGFYRPFIAFITFLFLLLPRHKAYLKVDFNTLKYIALLGFISQTLFNQFYYGTIQRTTISTAVVLLYTSPIFVMVIARFLYREMLTPSKIAALILSILGCFLTITGGSVEVLKLNGTGILLGLASGLAISFLPLISKNLVHRTHPLTIACYTMGFGALFSLLFFNPQKLLPMSYDIKVWGNLIALGVLSNALAYLFYTKGMSMDIQSSKASIVNTVEVPVAVLTSYLFFGEQIWGLKLFGILLVLLSVVIIEYGIGFEASLKKNRAGL